MSRKWEDKPEWEKIFEKDLSDKELLSKIYKELLNFNNIKTTQLKSGPKTLTCQKDIHMTNKHLKRCLTTYAIKKKQIKTRQHYTPLRPKFGTLTTPNAGEDVEQQEL